MVVFLDLVILVNLIVNFFLLYITGRTLKLMINLKRMFLGAFIGSIYTITLIYPCLSIFSAFYFKLIVALALVYISFGNKGIITNFKILCIFILYSMLLAGICIFIQYNRSSYINGTTIINFPYQWLFISLMIFYITIDRLVIYIKDRRDLFSLVYEVDIIFKDKEKKVKAFLDTGNELREPATNLPVVIVEKSVFGNVNLEEFSKFHIPYRVINGSSGKLLGFKPDVIKINFGKEVKYREVIIALCQDKLSQVGDYHALLSRGVI
ncbi:sigma-E processing peptidase SpoIIGA [Clostridium sp. BJN0013]|uniref:sigma-E processing peptidase SpoIIGA n=1 Tax=Clostridium sp. BJN0013 TaxID=3236840 RepID=UPI0034C6AD0C